MLLAFGPRSITGMCYQEWKFFLNSKRSSYWVIFESILRVKTGRFLFLVQRSTFCRSNIDRSYVNHRFDNFKKRSLATIFGHTRSETFRVKVTVTNQSNKSVQPLNWDRNIFLNKTVSWYAFHPDKIVECYL